MKATKKKSRLNKAKDEETPHYEVIVKSENEPGPDSEAEAGGVYTNGDGLSIRIKEEPHAEEICEETGGDTSSCPGVRPDSETSWADVQHPQGHVKEECPSPDHQCELTGAAVKEEAESWIKEERDSEEEEEEEAGDIQEDYEEREEVSTGGSQVCHKHTQPGDAQVFSCSCFWLQE